VSELKFVAEETRRPIDIFTMWIPRVAVAMGFLAIGTGKFAAHSVRIRIFAQIGFGQWFRYLTGVLQIGGALLVLIPRTFALGILLLACTMLGAMLAWIFVLHAQTRSLARSRPSFWT
jgi:putative oxidoreductase